MRKKDYIQAIEDQGFELVYDPPGDGNCQFAALSHQVKKLGILRSAETTRKEIAAYLESNPNDSNGFPLLNSLADNGFASSNDRSYGTRWSLWGSVNAVCGS